MNITGYKYNDRERRLFMFMAEGYPREEYLEVPEGSVEFPKEICIAYAVCSNNCGNAEFIVDGSSQVCQYCGRLLFRTEVKKLKFEYQ